MKRLAALAILIAVVALVAMSFAPAELVGARAGFHSLAGWATAVALAVIGVAGAALWLDDKRHRDD